MVQSNRVVPDCNLCRDVELEDPDESHGIDED